MFDERVKDVVVDNLNGEAKTNNSYNQTETVFTNPALRIIISNATAKWSDSKVENSLDNINLTIEPSRLTAVIGPVGSGKVNKYGFTFNSSRIISICRIFLQSSLIQVILQELPLTQGTLSVQGVVSYASQEPWLFAGSVQQNILFGSPMDKERYKKVKK